MKLSPVTAGFVGFGEVNSPRDLILRKCLTAKQALESRGVRLVATDTVSDDKQGIDERRAREELSRQDFDVLVICVAGWIPSHSVIDVIMPFAHKPMVLWGLTGEYVEGRLLTTADQAGTTAIRAALEALGLHFKYIYDRPDAPYAAAEKVVRFCEVARAAALLKRARIGMMGYRDMNLSSTLVDFVSLRRVVGPEVEIFETLEMSQAMEGVKPAEVGPLAEAIAKEWHCERPLTQSVLEPGIRLFLAVMQKVRERGYEAVSLIDVDGVRKLLHFLPAIPLMLLADKGGIASIPENDAPGAVTQLIVRYLTGQVGAYFEFYEFMQDRILIGVPDYVPSEVVEGQVEMKLAKYGDMADGVMNVSKVKTGRVTLCRLGNHGERYCMHIVTGEAVAPRKWEEAGWEQPAPQLPGLEVILDTPVDDLAEKVLGQHYILAYGDQRPQLVDLCRLLGIEVL